MVIIPVQPFDLTTNGGYSVTISGLFPYSHDCIIGTLVSPSGISEGSWNLSGIMRGGSPDCNLDPSSNEMMQLSRIARSLGHQY